MLRANVASTHRKMINSILINRIYSEGLTLEIGLDMRDAIYRMTGHYPHVIINNLHRTRVDPNRNIEEAADGNPDAEKAWNRFQGYIDSASDLVTGEFGKGLFINLHGHRHLIRRTELRYLLSGEELQFDDEMLDLNLRSDISRRDRLVEDISKVLLEFIRIHYFPDSGFTRTVEAM